MYSLLLIKYYQFKKMRAKKDHAIKEIVRFEYN